MLTSKVAKRYAQGLLDFTQESGNTETVFAEMKDVRKIMNDSKELNAFFATPFIDSKKKMAAAGEIFKAFSPVSQNMISMVIKQGRETEMKNIAQEFINKVEDMKGIQRVTLTSATELSADTVNQILSASGLVKQDASYDLDTRVNKDILGGYILRVGDQQIDASVKNKLDKLRKDFHVN
ncbi:ATP synthase F1 subunit delta [Chryseobacterium sp. MFBS3-17]|uniref:ATP synthase F1 subunit delta n=1 Tax=Chryseobacterium sp. MFBS3-17 TaxID=2886689 RepID=UPI001D0E2D2C|nr:ATP synthase F1 subunit delta [Chryseobacterium sp. MFBS3-17]MCC2591731.1 ATP synthase F1 subunit delta [Chryseobacterium sp. MFBS3-17]